MLQLKKGKVNVLRLAVESGANPTIKMIVLFWCECDESGSAQGTEPTKED